MQPNRPAGSWPLRTYRLSKPHSVDCNNSYTKSNHPKRAPREVLEELYLVTPHTTDGITPHHGELVKTKLVLVAALFVAGCSSGTSSTTSGTPAPAPAPAAAVVTGIAVASKVTAVDPKLLSGPAKIAASLRRALLSVPSFPSTSDYSVDPTFTYVQDRSTDALSNVNSILCMISQTNYASMVNKGPYKALVDQNQCGGNNGSTSGGAPNYAPWTINVTRDSNSSDEIVQAWVHNVGNGGSEKDKLITAKLVVSEAASDTNPTGIFRIDYAQFPAANGVPTSTTPSERGILQAKPDSGGNIVLSMVGDGDQGSNQVAFVKSADRSSGYGTSTETQTGGPTNAINFAYNTSYVEAAPTGGATPICLDRSNVDLTAWNYGLYDADGTRVNVNAGFPIKVTRSGKDEQGSIGYFGAWLPNNDALVNGESVTRLTSNGGAAPGSYTALTSYGRLTKHSKKQIAMADIQKIPLSYNDMSSSGPNGPTQFRVTWDGTNLVKDATWSNNSNSWANLTTPVVMDLTALRNPSLNMFSEGLGGQVFLKAACTQNAQVGGMMPTFNCSVGDTTPVIFYAETTVFPGDSSVPATLSCTTNCPNPTAPAVGGMMASGETGMQAMSPAASLSAGKFASYAFDGSNYTLKFGSATGPAVDGSALSNGVNSGPLFDASVAANLTALSCNNGGTTVNANQTCGWQAWSELPEFYTWTSGSSSWQQLATLKDATGAFVTFDQPLQLQYSHTGDGYANATFFLQYNGFGNLNGIPGKCVDMDSGASADCSMQQNNQQIRWVPEFTIGAGESVVGPKNTTYYLKPLQVEQRMKAAPAGSCGGLTMTPMTLPTISSWVDPAMSSEPAVAGPAAVIGGVTQ